MFRSGARSVAVRLRSSQLSFARLYSLDSSVSSQVATQAQHILNLSSPLDPHEDSLIFQQTELLKQVSKEPSPANLDLALKVYDKVMELSAGADKFSCARLSILFINAGMPDKALEPWTRLLEGLSSRVNNATVMEKILSRHEFDSAAMAALAAYFMLSGPAMDPETALKLVPRQQIPGGPHVLGSLGSIDSDDNLQLIKTGLAKLRKHVTQNFSSDKFIAEVGNLDFGSVSKYWEQVNLASTPSEINETCYAAFIRQFAATSQTKTALKVWQQMVSNNVPVSTVGWAAILKCALHLPTNSAEVFASFWDKMISNGFKPDAACYTEKMLNLSRNKKLEEALKLFAELKPEQVETRCINTLVSSLARAKRFEEADELVKFAQSHNIPLNSITFNALFKEAGGKNAELGSTYLKQMTELGIRPDIYTYTHAVDRMLKRGQSIDALLDEMTAAGIKPNDGFQTMLVYNIGNISGGIEQARQLLKTMMDKKLRISRETLGAFIELELRHGEVSRAAALVKMGAKVGVPPSVPAHNQLIRGALRKQEYDIAVDALDTLLSGNFSRLSANTHTYMALLTSCTNNALQINSRMRLLIAKYLGNIIKSPELVDFKLAREIERIDQNAPELVDPQVRELASKRALELFDSRKTK